MQRFARAYLSRISGDRDSALDNALTRIRAFLREQEFGDFESAEQFADILLEELDTAWARGWGSKRTRDAIAGIGREIYGYYRLRDTTVFGDSSPIRLRLGGPDRVSIRFVGQLDHFYFSKFADNTSTNLRKFFIERYLENGAALFGRETSEEMLDFREAAGEKLKNLTDQQTYTIVHTATARIRNWAHIGTMDQASIEFARLVATLDARTSQFCLTIDGKLIRVGVAQDAIQRLNKLEPAEFAEELYGSDLAKRVRQEPGAVVREYTEDDGKTIKDELVATGLGFPPFHPNCRTRMEGVIEGVEDDDVG